MSLKKRFPLPNPFAVKFTYCKIPIEDAPKTSRIERKFHDCGYCAGCDKRRMGQKTASVAGFPFLCENCYRMVYLYSRYVQDPYRIKSMWEDEKVSVKTTRKIIACARRLEFVNQSIQGAMIYEMFLNREDPDEEDDATTGYTVQSERQVEQNEYQTYSKMLSAQKRKWETIRRNEELSKVRSAHERLRRQIAQLDKNAVPFNPYERNDYDQYDNDIFYAYLNTICVGADKQRIAKAVLESRQYLKEHPYPDVTLEFYQSGNIYLTCLRYEGKSAAELIVVYRAIIDHYKKDFPKLNYDAGRIHPEKGYLLIVIRCFKLRDK